MIEKKYGELFKKLWDAELMVEREIGKVTQRPVISLNIPEWMPRCHMCNWPLDEKGCTNIHCRNELFRRCLAGCGSGVILEFGVASGETINQIALLAPDCVIYGFDSWEGLPEDWKDDYPSEGYKKGSFKCDMPHVQDNVTLIKGMFQDTLPSFVKNILQKRKIAFIHMDADIYSSTKYVLDYLARETSLRGVIIQFDEYDNPNNTDEERAFLETMDVHHLLYKIIGACPPPHRQVAFLIKEW